jgi:hypothetical protein
MDRVRHKAEAGEKYSLYFKLLHGRREEYSVGLSHMLNIDEKIFRLGHLDAQMRSLICHEVVMLLGGRYPDMTILRTDTVNYVNVTAVEGEIIVWRGDLSRTGQPRNFGEARR